MRTHRSLWIGLFAVALGIIRAQADVTLNPLFTDNGVLQQGVKVPIWGTATPGERVTV